MLDAVIMSTFACDDCGSISITLPANLTDSARVMCSSCGRDYGCWFQFKQDAERIISAEPPQRMNGDADLYGAGDRPSRESPPNRQ